MARFCSLEGTLDDLQTQNQRLADYIDEHLESMPPEALARLLRVYDEISATLVALLRDERGRRSAEPDSGLSDLVMETLVLMEREGQ